MAARCKSFGWPRPALAWGAGLVALVLAELVHPAAHAQDAVVPGGAGSAADAGVRPAAPADVAAATALAAIAPRPGAACAPGNLLSERRPALHQGEDGELALLTDGNMVPDGSPWNVGRAVRYRGTGAVIVWDLGAPSRVRSVALQGDNNDVFMVSGSLDGQTFVPFWSAPAMVELGQRLRVSANVDVAIRYLRVDPVPTDGVTSLTEVQAFCDPAPPADRTWLIRSTYETDRAALRYRRMMSSKAAIVLAAIGLLAFMARRPNPRRDWGLFAAALVLSAAAWTDFGIFHNGLRIHPSDNFHYYFGPKYFDETGYFDFYTCIAAADRELGHGADIDAGFVRDLHDNRLHPGTWTRTPEGRCGGTFSPRRWEEFKRDLALYRPNFPPVLPLIRMLADHGYNGTPITTTLHRAIIGDAPADKAHILGLTWMDALSNVLAVLFIAWGLGPRAGILAGLVIAFGEPWGYQWIGGTIGRATWVVCLAAGIAFAARGYRRAAGVALSLSTLLRLFPAVFLGALGLSVVLRSLRARAVAATDRAFLAAVAITLALGIGLAGLSVGFGAFSDWAAVIERHAATPPANHLGFARVADYQPGNDSSLLADPNLTDPLETFSGRLHDTHRERLPLHALAIVTAFGLLVWSIRRGATDAECIALGGPLLFSLMAITNYDAVWLVAMVPLVVASTRRTAALLGLLAVCQLFALWLGNIEQRCIAQSFAMLAFMVFVVVDYVRELERRGSEQAPPGPAPHAEPSAALGEARPG